MNQPMPLGSLESTSVVLLDVLGGFGALSDTMVEVEEDRLKVFANGARWVSLSSLRNERLLNRYWCRICLLLVSFQDMAVLFAYRRL